MEFEAWVGPLRGMGPQRDANSSRAKTSGKVLFRGSSILVGKGSHTN